MYQSCLWPLSVKQIVAATIVGQRTMRPYPLFHDSKCYVQKYQQVLKCVISVLFTICFQLRRNTNLLEVEWTVRFWQLKSECFRSVTLCSLQRCVIIFINAVATNRYSPLWNMIARFILRIMFQNIFKLALAWQPFGLFWGCSCLTVLLLKAEPERFGKQRPTWHLTVTSGAASYEICGLEKEGRCFLMGS